MKKSELITDAQAYSPTATPETLDRWRFQNEKFNKAEIQASQPAETVKNEWVWVCPFCQCRNYYLAKECKRGGCWTMRVKFRGENEKLVWMAVQFVPSANPPQTPAHALGIVPKRRVK